VTSYVFFDLADIILYVCLSVFVSMAMLRSVASTFVATKIASSYQ